MLKDWAKLSGFVAILSVVLTFGILWALDYVPQNSEWSCKTDGNTNSPNNGAEQSISCRLTQAKNLYAATHTANSNAEHDTSDGIKTTDVLLAVFTGLLVVVGAFQAFYLGGTLRATGQSAEAALRQANAVVALEAPVPSVHQMKLVGYANEADLVGNIDPVPPGVLPNISRPGVWVRNYGRSNMYLGEWACNWLVALTLPPIPHYEGIAQQTGFLPPDDRINHGSWFFDFDRALRLTDQERAEIQNGNAHLWIFGYFTYRDFVDDAFIFGFMSRWDMKMGLVRQPDSNYEYQRRR